MAVLLTCHMMLMSRCSPHDILPETPRARPISIREVKNGRILRISTRCPCNTVMNPQGIPTRVATHRPTPLSSGSFRPTSRTASIKGANLKTRQGESTHENERGNFPSSWLEMILLSCYQDLSGMHRSPKFLERQQPGNFRVFQSHSAAAPGNFSPSLGEKPPEYQASTGRKSPNSMEIYGSENHRTIAGSTSKPCLSTKRQPGNGKAASSGKVTCYLKFNNFMFFVKWAGFISGSHKQMGQNQFLVSFKNRPAMMDSIKSLYTCVHQYINIHIYICMYIHPYHSVSISA